jgi:molybdopterin converting factor small subunit
MIRVDVRYHNVLRRVAGVEQQRVILPDGTSLTAFLERLAERRGPGLREFLLTPEGDMAPSLVVFRNGQLVRRDQLGLILADGDELKLFPMISGGH